MEDIRNEINQFLKSLESKFCKKIPQFCHNLNAPENKVYYGGAFFDSNELSAAIETLLYGKWSSGGEKTNEFEKEFSNKINQKYSFFCNSGSSANLLLMAACKEYFQWEDNSEILVSVVGFPTTTSSILHNNLKPVFIDIEWNTLNFNLDKLEQELIFDTEKNIKAIFISPVLGNPPDFDRLIEISEKYNTTLLLDNCLLPGQKVITDNGIKNIEDADQNDKIYSHSGLFNKIQETSKTPYDGDILEIKTYGFSDSLKITPNHPVLCVQTDNIRENRELKWKKSSEITENDYLVFPRYKENNDIEFYDIKKYEHKTKKVDLIEKFEKRYKDKLPVNDHLMTLIGWYLSEGYVYRSHVSFSLSKKETENHERIFSSVKALGFDFNFRETKTTLEINIFNKQFKLFVEDNFGTGAKNKKIPKWVIDLPNEKLSVLLDNYILGDGCAKGSGYVGISISLDLLIGFKIICSKLGYSNTVSQVAKAGKSKILGRTVNVNNKYQLRFSKLENENRNHMDKKIYIDNNNIYFKVREINKKYYKGDVYNFKVEKDNSYIVGNWCVHNCDSLGSKWNGKYLNEYCVASSCSFYPAHEITTLEGGMVSSNIEEIINLARSYGSWGKGCFCQGVCNLSQNGACGRRFSSWLPDFPEKIVDHRYVFERIGWNLKSTDLQAAIGVEQLKKLTFICDKRKENQKNISNLFLKYIKNSKSPIILEKTGWVPFGTPIICQDKDQKYKLVQHLEKNGIQTRNYFAGNLLIHPGYKHLDNYLKYPEANKVLDLVFFVGCAPTISDKNIQYIESILQKYEQS